ncbi:phage tail protein [Xenorhabdus szentirmaii]|uniref:phage tail protein n=1 Tax=Xenorhabdus szentirmaii TaxID=290112 RepID=UPI0032B7F04F
MNTKYFSLLTNAGTDKLKKSASSGTKLEVTHMAVGDGKLPTPDVSQSKLINEKYRAEIDSLTIDPQNHNLIITGLCIPEGKGNWWVREIGLFDKEGVLIAVGNCEELYKPESQEQMVCMSLTIDNHNLIGSIGLISGIATRQYVKEKIKTHAESRNHPDATLTDKGLVALSNEINSDSETLSATPKAVKTTYELADKAYQLATTIVSTDKYVPSTRLINDKELTQDIKLTASDVGAYDKKESDEQINKVKTQSEQNSKLADTANKNAEAAIQEAKNKVPLTRTINNHKLYTDINLTASDVGAYNIDEIKKIIQDINRTIGEIFRKAQGALHIVQEKVPQYRTVNGKELSTDIQLSASDVGAYDKQETNNRIDELDKQIKEIAVEAETAFKDAKDAIHNLVSKVPMERKVNNRALTDDIFLTAADIDTYTRDEVLGFIQDVTTRADDANNNANNKVPLKRTINGKSLLADINLTSSDVGGYNKSEIDIKINDMTKQISEISNNANSRIPSTRTVNGKSLLTDIILTASDMDAYSKADVDARINNAESLSHDANINADSRLAKSMNGSDILDKHAFVRNLGLGELIGLKVESRHIDDDHTIVRLGHIFMINGFAVASEAISDANSSVIGGVTYYTHFYKIKLPETLPNGIISCHASIAGDNFDDQHPGYLADVKTQRIDPKTMYLSRDTLTVSVMTPHLGWTPNFYYQVTGY